jgi:hypothetical protein
MQCARNVADRYRAYQNAMVDSVPRRFDDKRTRQTPERVAARDNGLTRQSKQREFGTNLSKVTGVM